MEALFLVVIFLLLLAIGVPIAYSIGLAAMSTLLLHMDTSVALTTIAQRMVTGLDSFSLLAIPFFILAGQIMNQGGIANRLINFAKAVFGSLPGGLAYVNVMGCMLFGAISGSAVAAASAIGGIMTSRMEKEGYGKPLSAAVNITASTTGLVIPPSNVLIVYSLASGGVSVAALFLAGYIPGLLMGLALILTILIFARRNKLPAAGRTSFKELRISLWKASPSLFLLVLVMGGIVLGVFTATEASAIAVLYALALAFFYKELTFNKLSTILIETVHTTAIVLFLVATSMSMSWVLAYENIPQDLSAFLLGLSENGIVILLIINLILLFVGIFMDMTPAVLIFTPIFLPVVTNLGIHPVHFGIMMVMNLCIGLCTPPVGSVLFVGVSVAKIKVQQVLRPLVPLFIALIVVLLLVTFFEDLSLWLPTVLGI